MLFLPPNQQRQSAEGKNEWFITNWLLIKLLAVLRKISLKVGQPQIRQGNLHSYSKVLQEYENFA